MEARIWEAPHLDQVTKKIVGYAIRTALDIVGRDAKSLVDAVKNCGGKNKLYNLSKVGVLVCRMRWYREHCEQVLERFKTCMGIDFISKVREIAGDVADGKFLELITAMIWSIGQVSIR